MRTRTWIVAAVLIALLGAMPLGGCYYVQAINGQVDLLRKREPIDTVLTDSALPEETRQKLDLVRQARRFAVDELLLPDNGSYTTYADLERDYVVWNVFAAPEFSLTPKTWCFPVVGCVAYRGYFSKASAERQAARLAEKGLDVFVGGVPAYSTLGRFEDPVLNTMMRWSDADLVTTLFHELAHQRLFIKNDTAFNESFATALAEEGLRRWLAMRGEEGSLDDYRRREEFRSALTDLANRAREELAILYAGERPETEKRNEKQRVIETLREDARTLAVARGFSGPGWLGGVVNNARLAAVGLYRSDVPAFQAVLDSCSRDLACFYAEVERLSELDADERRRRLDALASVEAANASRH
ncbi:MAG: aminopeptidase [Pseudomonadota bacterium]